MEFDYHSIYSKIQEYFESLNQNEQYAWLLIGVGTLLVFTALFIMVL